MSILTNRRSGRVRRVLGQLYVQTLIGVVAGAAIGLMWPRVGAQLQPLGEGFIALIKMLIAPLIFCTISTGIASMKNLGRVGRISMKALVYFEVLTTLAMLIGLVVANVVRPGAGLHVDPSTLSTSALPPGAVQHEGVADFVLSIIPTTLASAFTSGDILPVVFVSILVGVALHGLGEACAPLLRGIESVNQLVFTMLRWVMRTAPIGALGSMAYTAGMYGPGTLTKLGGLVATFWITASVFVVIILGTVMRLNGLSLFRFLRFLKDELLIVLGTSSTEPVLPRLMIKLERLGVPKPVVGLVVPSGYSFNLDGTAIYLTMGATFLAQALDIHLSWGQQIGMLLIMLITSKGAAGVAGSGFIALASTLSAVPHVPVAAMALILGVDRFLSEARALTSLVGNGVATLAIARWEGVLDVATARRVLAGDTAVPSPETEPGPISVAVS